jgi:hypothetical protein
MCAMIQIIQPFIFLGGILIATYYELVWAYFYLVSVALAFVIFLRIYLRDNIYNLFTNNSVKKTTINFQSLFILVLASMSFPVFFQLELFIVGEFTKFNLGEYTIVQKMYSSVSVALFSGLLVYMYGESKQGFNWKNICTLPLLSAFVVCCLAIVLAFLGKDLDKSLLVVTVIVSYVFSVAMFITFAMNIDNTVLNIKLLFISMSVYLLAIVFINIESQLQMLLTSLYFYGSYIFLYVVNSRRLISTC